MSKKGDAPIIGYKYFLGVHKLWCHGVVDAIREIRVDNRLAWSGFKTSPGPIEVDAAELFGKTEGGVSGTVDFEKGGHTQGVNSYLDSKINGIVPAYRGVTGTVLRQTYLGNNPYLKKWSAQFQRVYRRIVNGEESLQWNTFYAGIPGESGVQSLEMKASSILFQMDISSRSCGFNNANMTLPGYTTIQATKDYVVEALTYIRDNVSLAAGVNIGVAYFRHSTGGVNENNNPAGVDPRTILPSSLPVLPERGLMVKLDATLTNIDELIQYAQGLIVVPDTDTGSSFDKAYYNAQDFYALTGTGDIRANYTVSSFSSSESRDSSISNAFGLNNILSAGVGDGIKGGVILGSAPDATNSENYFLPTSLSNYGFTNMTRACIQLSSGTNDWGYGKTDGPPVPDASVFDGLCGNPADVFDGRLADGLVADGAQILTLGQINPTGTIFAGRMFTNLVFVRTSLGTQTLYDTSTGRTIEDNMSDIIGNLPVDAETDTVGNAQFSSGAYVLDMNPAHMIRECLTDTNWGMYQPESDVTESSFFDAALTLYNEEFGLSTEWKTGGDIEAFVQDILRHIDATLYVRRDTGKWILKLIRADYDIDDLPVFTGADIIDMEDLQQKKPSDIYTSVTVTYNDRKLRNSASVIATNVAQSTQLGSTVPTVNDYPMIWKKKLAQRVAERDLRSLSYQLKTGEFLVNRKKASELYPGEPFRINDSRFGLSGEVFRVVEVDLGDGRENTVRVTFVEDVFSLGSEPMSPADGDPSFVDPSLGQTPKIVSAQATFEQPYYDYVRTVGPLEADLQLTDNPDFGKVAVSASRPSTGFYVNGLVEYDDGSGWTEGPSLYYAPILTLSQSVSREADDVTFTYVDGVDVEEIEIGTLGYLEDEIVRVDDVTSTTVTIGRGCLDTVPVPHPSGSKIVFWGRFKSIIGKEFVASDSVDTRVITYTADASLSSGAAAVYSVTLDSRASRPYPVGNLKVNGFYSETVYFGTLFVTWSHRDRILQTGDTPEDFTYGNIGPEAGVVYTFKVDRYDENDTFVSNIVSVDVTGLTSYDFDSTLYPIDGFGYVRIYVEVTRDGYSNWTKAHVDALIPLMGANALPKSVLLDANVLGSLFQLTDGTVPVTANDDPVGFVENQNGDVI